MNEFSRAINREVNYIKAFMFQVKVSLFDFLAKHGIVKKHVNNDCGVIYSTLPTRLEDLKGDRYVYNMSYIYKKVKEVHECWYETNDGKRLFTLSDEEKIHQHLEFRADLHHFLVRFSPFDGDHVWVDVTKYAPLTFYNCRRKFTFPLNVPLIDPKNPPFEVISKSYKEFKDLTDKNIPDINLTLSGVKNDGWLVDKDNHPLCENILCKGCHCPVFSTDSRSPYIYNCINHGIIDHTLVNRVSHNVFEESLRYNFNHLKKYCE